MAAAQAIDAVETVGQTLRRLLFEMAGALVDDPGAVEIRVQAHEDFVELDLKVAAEERGKVIGRKGRTAQALRTIVFAASTNLGVRCELNIQL